MQASPPDGISDGIPTARRVAVPKTTSTAPRRQDLPKEDTVLYTTKLKFVLNATIMPGTKTKNLNIDTSKPVLVTGATGYVAGVLIRKLVLECGLTVHATVRDPSKKERIQYLEDCCSSSTDDVKSSKKKGSIKFFAGDLLQPGSFDEAAKGCSVIFHTASPFVLDVKDVDKDLLDPAIKGTENVLTTANKTPTVKRVVLTSSCAAIYNHASDLDSLPGGVWTEEVWNRGSTRDDNPYSLSKTLAEQKAWVMAGSQTQWKLVVINPAMVMGPGLKYHPNSESFRMMEQIGGGAMSSSGGAPPFPIGVVDVRDVAAAHVAAAFLPDASGRHILCSSNSTIPAMAQAIAEKYPPPKYPVGVKELPIPKMIMWALAPLISPLSRAFVKNNLGYKVNFDNSKAKVELGIDFYPLSTTMQDMYQQLLDEKVVTPVTDEPVVAGEETTPAAS